VLDGAGAILNFTGTPTFTGTGWIEINQNSTLINGTSGTLTISAPVRIASGATLTVTTNAHTVEFGGGVTGAGTLTIGDTGTVQFDATSTFATLNPGSSAILLNSAASLAANMILSQATTIDVIATGTATATVSGVISGAFRLTKGGNNSTLSLTALNTFSGGLTVTGGSVSGSAPSAFGTSGIALSATSSSNPATLKPTATMTIPNSITVPANDYGAVSIPSGVTLTPSGAVTLGASSSLTLSGSGAIVLQAATTAPSTSSINLTGVTTSLMLGASLGSAGITVATASTLSSLSNFTGANAITNAFTVSAPLTITGPINTTTTLTGLITASASSIIKTGAGTVVIVPAAGNTANNISALSLQGGTLQLINTNADPIGTSCAVTQSPNTTLISPAQATTMTPGVGVSSAVTVSVN
jgi:hypothetical protein